MQRVCRNAVDRVQTNVHVRTARLPTGHVYLLDSYNWIDFIVLSLYLASYVLRFLVNHRVRQADLFYNCITARSRDTLAARDFRLYDVIVNETFGNRSSSVHNYFMKACKNDFDFIGLWLMSAEPIWTFAADKRRWSTMELSKLAILYYTYYGIWVYLL